jgi:uncharacterized protein (DUF433 family)
MATDDGTNRGNAASSRIVSDDLFDGEPRLRGHRISVLDVYEYVEEGDMTPSRFAETYDVDVETVYCALGYYHTHATEMETHREAREQAMRDVRERVASKRPKGISPGG